MKKDKRYEFSNLGYVKLLWDLRQEKLGKINGVVGIAVILGMCGIGILSKEFLIIILTSKGIGKVTSMLVG